EGGDLRGREDTRHQAEVVDGSVPGIAGAAVVQAATHAQAAGRLEHAVRARRLPREHPVDVEPLLPRRGVMGPDDEVPFARARTDLTGRDAGGGARRIAGERGEGEALVEIGRAHV